MADSRLLEKLHDIHLPEPISWWPLAPGWYALILSAILVVGLLIHWGYRYYRQGRARREALQLLNCYWQAYQRGENSQQSSSRISELLRRVALVYFPRQQVAGLQGSDWIKFLNSTGKGVDFNTVKHCLLELPYQEAKSVDLKPLFSCAKAWIRQRGTPCSS
ncbi:MULTISPECIES: DUF4381 domain-containing protein [unclassified Legionella]|uniref:DUF4381 domain-containing protein n=1 Tax=unclassified Legionella TaxID=2622702 RepID=UPI001055D64C|nr:DUF4381 domain-containing protein [Legionella sp. W10-070]MDI9819646.1 DUF4381 domain-containing protein [Legionella sp. PL877]